MVMSNYRIIAPLGKGGNCEAYLAEYGEEKRKVTVKKCREIDGEVSAGIKKNMETEARILSGLNHRSIPKFIEKSGNTIVLEYMPGDSLEKILLKRGAVKEKEAARIAKDLAGILRYLHGRREPVIYRDLKPANIVISEEGKVSLIDFGAARYYKPYERSDTVNLGTMGFAAPEQFGNLGQTDPRTDIYCLGMTLLQMVSGVNTQDAEAVTRYKQNGVKGISPEFMSIIRKCTSPDRGDRFKSAKEIMIALDNYPKMVRKRGFRKAVKALAAAFFISVLVAGAVAHSESTSALAYEYGEMAKEIAIKDANERLPQVKLRFSYARTRIEEYLKDRGLIIDEKEKEKIIMERASEQ